MYAKWRDGITTDWGPLPQKGSLRMLWGFHMDLCNVVASSWGTSSVQYNEYIFTISRKYNKASTMHFIIFYSKSLQVSFQYSYFN